MSDFHSSLACARRLEINLHIDVQSYCNLTSTMLPKITWCPAKPWDAERFQNFLSVSLDARQLTNGGPLQVELEHELVSVTGSERRILPAASGTAALHALCAAWSLKRGKILRWATQAFTFPSSVQGPLSDAVVVDNDWSLGGPCLAQLSEINESIDGVIVTNLFGSVSNIEAYEVWAKTHEKLVIFDNAATSTGFWHNKSIHDFGDGSIISLHETKPIGRGEGGAIFVDHGMHDYVYRAQNFGFSMAGAAGVCRTGHRSCSNWRMSDIAAAAVMTYLREYQEKTLSEKMGKLLKCADTLCLQYSNKIMRLPGLTYPDPPMPPCLFLIVESWAGRIDELIQLLSKQPVPIEAKQYYRPLADKHAAPSAWDVFNKSICMPIHVEMEVSDVSYMLDTLVKIMQEHGI